MIAALHGVWLGLARRERILASIGLAITASALLFVVAIEPAWRARARIAAELPSLREQVAEMTALAQEAEALRGRAGATMSTTQLRMAIDQSLSRAGLKAQSATGPSASQLTVSGKGLSASDWLIWLEQTVRQMRLRVTSAKILRTSAAGTVDCEVTFDSAEGQ